MRLNENAYLCEPRALQRMAAQTTPAARKRSPVSNERRVAVVGILGPLFMDAGTAGWFGGTAYLDIADEVKRAAADPKIGGILYVVDSPGGGVSGVDRAADEISKASKVKPSLAYVLGQAASAGYWLASQAGGIVTGRMSETGSIGVFSVVVDNSAQYEQAGVKVSLIATGQYKGQPMDGVAVSDAVLANEREQVNHVFGEFIKAVSKGRRMTEARVRQAADGRMFFPGDAQRLGLIDGVVATPEAALAMLAADTLNGKGTQTFRVGSGAYFARRIEAMQQPERDRAAERKRRIQALEKC